MNCILIRPSLTIFPKKADGTEYTPPVFSAARIDGFNESSATIDLRSGFRAIMSEGPVGTGFTNFAISPNAAPSRAFYYEYKEGCTSNEFSDSCYTLKRSYLVGVREEICKVVFFLSKPFINMQNLVSLKLFRTSRCFYANWLWLN